MGAAERTLEADAGAGVRPNGERRLDEYGSILVIKLGALGDFFQAMGAFKRLRAVHPKARITLMTTKPYEGLARKSGYFDDVYVDVRPRWYSLRGWLALRRYLMAARFDRVYDLQNNDRTALYFRLFPRPCRPEWVGVAKGASHQDKTPDRRTVHIFDSLRRTLAVGGVDGIEPDDLRWMDGDVSALESEHGLRAPYVLLIPGSSPTRLMKRWPADHFIALTKRLVADGLQVVILGTNAESDATGAIAAAFAGEEENVSNVLDLTGRTDLHQLTALGRAAFAVIGNDTGPTHMLGPTGAPCIALYPGVSDPARFHPLGSNVHTIQKDHMADITVDEVYALFKKATQVS